MRISRVPHRGTPETESVGVGRKSITLRNKIGKKVNLNTPTHYYVTDSYAPKALHNDKDTVPYETSTDWK